MARQKVDLLKLYFLWLFDIPYFYQTHMSVFCCQLKILNFQRKKLAI